MILKNLIYILQSENYYFNRFLRFAYTHLDWWRLERRQKIVWTAKARTLWLVTALLFWLMVVLFYLAFKLPGLLVLPLLVAILPLIVGVSLAMFTPFDKLAKHKKIVAASRIIARSGVRVVGITGSYGKTSTKEILSVILARKFRVIKTSENVNTDIGIANFVIKNKDEFRQDGIFVVEMGAYKIGEIKKICRMVRPDYSILTGINESHLERFGSLENIIQGKFELIQETKKLSLLNLDDENIRKHQQRYAATGKSLGLSKADVANLAFREKFGGLEFTWQGTRFETGLLAEHNIALIILCARLAQELSMSMEEIQAGVKDVKAVAHRLESMYNTSTGISVIDDSYNGNFNGIVSGVEVLERATGRKVVLTPGLVELGDRMEEVHVRIGELYAKSVDLVLLIHNPMTDCIVKGLQRKGFKDFKIYGSTEEAHADLKNVLKRGDTIIFQNDLTDNYF